MLPRRLAFVLIGLCSLQPVLAQTEIGASRLQPNLVENIERPLRYRPDGGDFVIQNGAEFFNRPLYGGNTGFRVDGGDKPEFVLYLPGRGGNLRLAVRARNGARWLHEAAQIEMRYRPGQLLYVVRDPLLGSRGVLRITALAYAETEGLVVRAETDAVEDDVELVWAYGGVSGQRGKRDGDIGTESVPISQWFQLRPEFCTGNVIEPTGTGFVLKAKPATIAGVVSAGAEVTLAEAQQWNDLAALIEATNRAASASSTRSSSQPEQPIAVGRVPLKPGQPLFLSLQRLSSVGTEKDLATYREVTAPRAGDRPAQSVSLASVFSPAELAGRYSAAERHFATLRSRVEIDTPDPFLNAAVGALNVAADAVWDGPQQAIMHGAIAWRTKLLGWRGQYSLDALGWHDRARQNITYWIGRQNTAPIPSTVPPPEESANLARNEVGLHTNGDMSNSHYDMNLVFIDALFRHLQWTGDIAFAKQVWPAIERHLAWERRLFRREFGPSKLPLYEAYAAIWASDDLQYSGGGAMHASAYNYYHHRQAARVARLVGADPTLYEREADALARGMRELLWVTHDKAETWDAPASAGARIGDYGWFAEAKDLLGLQRVHPSAALWTFYHALDSEVPTTVEAWQMARYVDEHLPHLPVRGPGVPADLHTLGTSRWMPYDWSINNVVMSEAVHGALGFWQAGRPDEAWAITKGSLLAAMFMGISPGNVGSMSYLDVYRRESQRDFADGSGVLSRALVEGLFGLKPDALAGELRVTPGWPAAWERAELRHPDVALRYSRQDGRDAYVVEQRFSSPQSLRLVLLARRDRIAEVRVNGRAVSWRPVEASVGMPRVEILAPASTRHEVTIEWAGSAVEPRAGLMGGPAFRPVGQGQMRWLQADGPATPAAPMGARDSYTAAVQSTRHVSVENATFAPVDLTGTFNDNVTQIFKNEYRSPRSPFVSLALPKQGLGGWAGGVNKTAVIDDTGLRAAATRGGGAIVLPNGVPLATPAAGRNVVFVSQWDNYPRQAEIAMSGHARAVYLLVAGSTNAMQSRFENGAVVATYADGSSKRLPLANPINWWPIEQDYFIDDYQFNRPEPVPTRVDLKTGRIRALQMPAFKGRGRGVAGGAATVLVMPLDPDKELKTLTVLATANDVVIGLMAATLVR